MAGSDLKPSTIPLQPILLPIPSTSGNRQRESRQVLESFSLNLRILFLCAILATWPFVQSFFCCCCYFVCQFDNSKRESMSRRQGTSLGKGQRGQKTNNEKIWKDKKKTKEIIKKRESCLNLSLCVIPSDCIKFYQVKQTPNYATGNKIQPASVIKKEGYSLSIVECFGCFGAAHIKKKK